MLDNFLVCKEVKAKNNFSTPSRLMKCALNSQQSAVRNSSLCHMIEDH